MPDLLSNFHFYLVAIPAVMIYGISKGGFGAVFGIVSVPLMSMVISPLQATAILLPLLIAMDVFVLRKFWRSFDKRSIFLLVPSAALGVLAGYFTVGIFDENNARLLVGVIAIAFGLRHFVVKQNVTNTIDNKDKAKGLFWGTIAGFTSFHVHSGGPPVSAYLLPKQLPPLMYAGTTGVFFGLVNLIKLPAFIATGQLSKENLILALILLPLVPISVSLGYRLAQKFDVKAYYSIISIALILMGARLLYVGLMS